MKFCVIGAGAAGLCALKHGIDFGSDVTVFEQSDKVGGLWNYTEDIGKNKFGLDMHSTIYERLVVNAPKEIMTYPSVPFPEKEQSYVSSEEVRCYYQMYAEKFNLFRHIKFNHHVIRVRPLLDDKWEVIVKNLDSDKFFTENFDAVMVCNGRFTVPVLPNFEGHETFTGKQMHSRDYKTSEQFRGESVLIIGAGPSGIDITYEVSRVAKQVTWSHRRTNPSVTDFSANVNIKPDVSKITPTGAVFTDGSFQEYTKIVYCTGYKYSFPFLSVDCGLTVDAKCIEPLFKQCLNINRPTMAVFGINNTILPNQLFDLQARFCLTFMTGRKQMPSKQEMLDDLERETAALKAKGLSKSQMHNFGPAIQASYFDDLAVFAEIEPIKPVISAMFTKAIDKLVSDTANFRKVNYKIIDDFTFVTSED